MLHASLSVCVGHAGAKTAGTIDMPFGGGGDSCWSKEPCMRWGPDPARDGARLMGYMS